MGLDLRCAECFRRNYDALLTRYPLSESDQTEFSVFFENLMQNQSSLTSPEIQRELQIKLREFNGIADPYYEEKQQSNRLALDLYQEWKPRVLASDQPFQLALRLSIAGNIMDYGANQHFNLDRTIEQVLAAGFAIDHTDRLKDHIRTAGHIMYLGDNAGEIVFDKLLIETMMHPNVYYAVKGGPAINDATMDDAIVTGMDSVADVISTGYDVSSTILEKSDPEFRFLYETADLILSKGQGNFEGLLKENDPRLFFLLMVKCDLIAEKIGVPKGSFVVLNYGKN